MDFPKKIINGSICIVEGPDDENFLRKLFDEVNLNFQILNAKGKDNIPLLIQELHRIPGFDSVTKLLITRDADNSYQDAFRSINDNVASPR